MTTSRIGQKLIYMHRESTITAWIAVRTSIHHTLRRRGFAPDAENGSTSDA